MTTARSPIIPCEQPVSIKEQIANYAEALKATAPSIGDLGLTEQEFWDAGIFRAAIEQIRGTQVASMLEKRDFMQSVLGHLQTTEAISSWSFAGGQDRHDYEVTLVDGRIAVIEAKGCLDGNNTNIFERPAHADEFIIWSLCQNVGADPRKNAWSGIHTRLGAEIMHRGRPTVDGLVIWDMMCGTIGRPCPKTQVAPERLTRLANGKEVPPPCIYLFPRTIPDPRKNPTPKCWALKDISLLQTLARAFKGRASDVTEVRIEAQMDGAEIQRRTRLVRSGKEILFSEWTTLNRARR